MLVVPVSVYDDLSKLYVIVYDGSLELARGRDGQCAHLGLNGCLVYEHRPVRCRTFDCRLSLIDPSWDGEDVYGHPAVVAIRAAARRLFEQ